MRGWTVAGLVALGLNFFYGAAEAASSKTRTILIYDNSGSMRTNDPHRLAASAALLYVELAKKGDAVGLVVFDGQAQLTVPLHEAPRSSTFARKLARLRLNGRTSDIGQALDVALAALGPAVPGFSDVVVLMTDGKVDLGQTRRLDLPRERRRIRSTLVNQFRARRVPVYTIAFTEAADRGLLGEIAGRTQGAFRYIKTPQSLHRAFSEMFVVASGSSSLPLQDGAVVVDSAVKQTSLVMSKRVPGASHEVVAPDEEVLNAKSKRPGVTWKSSTSYDLVELNAPQAGVWQMKDKDGRAPPAMAIIQDSHLDLDVAFGPKDATVDDTLYIRAQLLDNGKRVSSFARLKSMSVEARIEAPDGQKRTVLFGGTASPGLFRGEVANTNVGQHGIVVTAISPALQRQWRGSYSVMPRCFEPKVETDVVPARATVRMAAHCPDYDALKIEVAQQLDGQVQAWTRLKRVEDRLYDLRLTPPGPGARGLVYLRIGAQTKDDYPILITPEPVRLPEVPEERWMAVVGKRLAYINLPLFGLIAVGLVVRRLARRPLEFDDD